MSLTFERITRNWREQQQAFFNNNLPALRSTALLQIKIPLASDLEGDIAAYTIAQKAIQKLQKASF